ncbi:MAG: acyl-CoA thioesterase [Planctomycetota bacterium]
METPKIPASESMSFRVLLRTRWSDEDTQGVLNNAVYPTLFEEARFAFFSAADQLKKNHFPFVLAQTNVVYLAPGRGGREVEVELATTHVGTSSFTQAYRIREGKGGQVLCEGEARLVCVDPATGRKTPMSEAFRRALTPRG